MKRCPECGAKIKNRSAVRCPACTAPLPAPRPSVGKHEIQSKSGRKPLIISDRQISSESDNKANSKRKLSEMASEERLPNTNAKHVSSKPFCDDSLYDGYYDDVLPSDSGEYRQGPDTRTMKNIAVLLAAMLVVVTICVIALLYGASAFADTPLSYLFLILITLKVILTDTSDLQYNASVGAEP